MAQRTGRRFISADVIATVKESLETLHNRNLYVYFDGNPLIKKIKDLNLWLYKENRKISSENVRYAGEMIKSTATTVVNYGISTTTSPAVKSALKAKREKGFRLVFMNGEINWIYW